MITLLTLLICWGVMGYQYVIGNGEWLIVPLTLWGITICMVANRESKRNSTQVHRLRRNKRIRNL